MPVSPVLARLRRRSGAPPLVLGHRGARHAAPENTHAAFELARREGAAGVELDVRLSGDGQVIVLHDTTLARVSPGADSRPVEALPYRELARADLGGSERVPLLSDVLDWARQHDLLVNVELKADLRRRRQLVGAVEALLSRHPHGPTGVVLSSFDPRFVWRLGRSLSRVPAAFLIHKRSALPAMWAFRALGAVAVHPEDVLVTAPRIERWRALDALIGVWTVNDESRAQKLASLGVDYLISDRPGAVLRALEGVAQSEQPE